MPRRLTARLRPNHGRETRPCVTPVLPDVARDARRLTVSQGVKGSHVATSTTQAGARPSPDGAAGPAVPWDGRLWMVVVGVLGLLFAATATWTLPYHIDALTNAYTGWYLGVEGTTIASGHEVFVQPGQRANTTWFVESPEGPVSQYPPGAALTSAPFYAASRPPLEPVRLFGSNRPGVEPVSTTAPAVWPATLSAVLVTAIACAAVGQVSRDLGLDRRRAIVTGVVVGVATGAWSVASNQSWTHGPGMMAVGVALLAFARDRWLLGGLALGFGVLVRPHLALVAAAVGVWVAWRRRDWRPLVGVGGGSSVGLAAVLAYNRAVWHTWTISGGYGADFGSNLTSLDFGAFAVNVLLGLVSPTRGLLVWAPFLLVLVPVAWSIRDRIPDWAQAASVGGALYLLVQWKANRYSGGAGFFAYRYPLEALVAAAPCLVLAHRAASMRGPMIGRLARLTLVAAATGQAVGAVVT